MSSSERELGRAARPGRLSLNSSIGGRAAAFSALHWRAGATAVLLMLPFAGVPIFIAGTAGLVARDLLVAALYVAFALAMAGDRERILPPIRLMWPAMALFSALVLAYTLKADTPIGGMIGVRVWLAYVPMAAIGYRYVRRIDDYESALRLTALLGLIPAALALLEWTWALTTGTYGPFAAMYGPVDVDPETVELHRTLTFTLGDRDVGIPRIPSTFTSYAHYFGFAIVAYAAALAMALRRGGHWWWCAAALAGGALLSGARAAYVVVPAITGAAILLSGPTRSQFAMMAGCAVAAVAIAASVESPRPFVDAMYEHIELTLRFAWDEMRYSMRLIGEGTGTDTSAALRHSGIAYGDDTGRRYVENFYGKVAVELGIAGLLAIGVAFGGIAFALVRGFARAGASTRRLVAPVLALQLAVVALLFKWPYIDVDPLNIYFWLLIGMTARALMLDDQPPASRSVHADSLETS